MADDDEVEPELPEVEEAEDVDEEDGVLPVVVVLPKRLVAAWKAEDALGADVDRTALEPAELEEADEEDAAEAVLLVLEEPRPRSLRLPRNRGAIKEE